MSDNPYQSPVFGYPGQEAPTPFGSASQRNSLGPFVLTILILDLVLCGLRLLMGAFGLAGYAVLAPDDPLRPTIIFEVGTAFGIALFGIPADTLILFKQRIGIPVAAIAIVFSLASMAVGLSQYFMRFQQVLGQMDGAQRTGMVASFILGGGIALFFRVALLGLYVAALVKVNKILSPE